MMALPPELLQAVSSPGGGKIALVLGAGCSVEAPTNIPVSSDCSNEIHRRLVDDGVLQNGDCSNPGDLSVLADAVFSKRNSQRDVVERLRDQYGLKLATPNQGYWIAAALLCEGAISSVVTLNYDLALSTALSALGADKIVGVVERPEDLPHQKTINVYYLHRNANAADPELWVLRTSALNVEWKGHWEPIIATKVLAAPVVVFAGLGTPVAVLIESTKLLRNALPGTTKLYQADPGNIADSKFFQALSLDPAVYIQCGWGQLMEALSQRLLKEQITQLEKAVERKIREDNLTTEDITTSHLIYASVKSGSSRGRASRESSLRIAHNGRPAYGSFAATRRVFQSSNDTVAGALNLVFCFYGCCGAGRSVRSRSS